ncbi:endolysin [Desulfofustis phage LS06-2018-MD01]|nr:endolysin [Desulfofustis phage LS06-2018-MD01]
MAGEYGYTGDLTTNFSRLEFACKCGCGFDTIDYAQLVELQTIRTLSNGKIIITSGCRCVNYNEWIDGAPKSQHLIGRATDIISEVLSPKQLFDLLNTLKDGKGGLILYDDFVHTDSRTIPYRDIRTRDKL